MLRLFTQLLMVTCVATIISLSLGLGYLWASGKLNNDKVFRMLALAHEIDLSGLDGASEARASEGSQEEMSYEQLQSHRARMSRDMELQKLALDKGLEQLRTEQRQVLEAQKYYVNVRNGFRVELAKVTNDALDQGIARARNMLENMKPEMAKDHIMRMIKSDEIDDVVTILGNMAEDRRKKIVDKFQIEVEKQEMQKIMRRIRQGYPVTPLVDETRNCIAPAGR